MRRCVAQKGSGFARQGKEGRVPRERACAGHASLPGAFEDQLAGSVRSCGRCGPCGQGIRCAGCCEQQPARRRQLASAASPLVPTGGRSGTTGAPCRRPWGAGRKIRGKSVAAVRRLPCGERAKVRRNLDPGMRSWPSIASSVNPRPAQAVAQGFVRRFEWVRREKAFRANRIFVPSPIRICCAGNARRRCL